MVHLQLLRSDEPVMIIQSDSVDTEKIKERNTEYPAVSEEETHRCHEEWHINVCHEVNPDDTVSVIIRIKYGRSSTMPIVPYTIPVPQHQWYRCPFCQEFIESPNLTAQQTLQNHPLLLFRESVVNTLFHLVSFLSKFS